MSIQEFLLWVSGGLGASAIASYFLERWNKFTTLPSDIKLAVKTLGASLLAILAYVTYTYVPVEVWVVLTPYWQIVLGVFTINYGVEVFHWFDKRLVK